MTAVDDFLAQQDKPARPEPERDRWGRYVIPDPDTGEKRSWTRATTHAKTCADTFGLTKWQNRMVALGLARRPDLVAQAAAITDPDDRDAKKALNRLADEAQEYAGRSVRANLGSALHSFTEQIDARQKVTAPPQFAADLDAYRAGTAGLRIDRLHIERIVTVPELGVAGTFDRLATLDGRLVVLDLKTGRDLSFSWGEIAIQLALYAHAQTIYDPVSRRHEPMPTVDGDVAVVVHLPVGEARCTLHTVDIAAGWEMAQVCRTVREWRKRKNLAAPYTPVAAQPDPLEPSTDAIAELAKVPFASDEKCGWLLERLHVLGDTDGAKQWVAKHWPADTGTKPPWTTAEADRVADMLSQAEQKFCVPFPEHRDPTVIAAKAEAAKVEAAAKAEASDVPALPPKARGGDGAPVDDLDHLKGLAAGLTPAQRDNAKRWATEAATTGRPFDQFAAMRARTLTVAVAAMVCAEKLHDPDQPDVLTRAALAVALEQPLHESWPTGALFGSLTKTRAEKVRAVAERFAAGDTDTARLLGVQIAAQPGNENQHNETSNTK